MARFQSISPSEGRSSSKDHNEIQGFAALAADWWDPDGPFAPLHRLNPARIRTLADICSVHFSRDLNDKPAFESLSLLDIGCGGGLIAEPFRRLGFDVTGADAGEENVAAAAAHADEAGLDITYLVAAPEDDFLAGKTFDAVFALEVVEHVADLEVFVRSTCNKVKPGGLLAFSTLNRTLRSLALGKGVAEYILNWVPAGTHSWSKFVKPSELARLLRREGFDVNTISGLEFDMSTGEWKSGPDVSVNYILAASRR
jgi:2-polyprenyl-6-hydroxyphenyl methylase/3-demethylubiquinone-9 3-methyltransferase